MFKESLYVALFFFSLDSLASGVLVEKSKAFSKYTCIRLQVASFGMVMEVEIGEAI